MGHMWIGLEVSGSWQGVAQTLNEHGFDSVLWLGLVQLLPFILINIILIRYFCFTDVDPSSLLKIYNVLNG